MVEVGNEYAVAVLISTIRFSPATNVPNLLKGSVTFVTVLARAYEKACECERPLISEKRFNAATLKSCSKAVSPCGTSFQSGFFTASLKSSARLSG